MFELLARVLVWILVGRIFWYVLVKFIPKDYLTWLGGLIVFLLISLAFFDSTSPTIDIIWKLISLPLKPLGLVILLLFLSLGIETKKFAWNMLWPTALIGERLLTAFLILVLTSNSLFAYYFARHAEGALQRANAFRLEVCQGACPVELDLDRSEPLAAIVVLGPAVTESNVLPAVQNRLPTAGYPLEVLMLPRFSEAAQLYREQTAIGNRPLVIVAEGRRADNESEKTEIISMLNELGVPGNAIVVNSRAHDIHDAGNRIKTELTEQGLEPASQRIAVLTPALNLSRASLTFAELDMRVFARPTSYYAPDLGEERGIQVEDIIPSVNALSVTTKVWEEHLTSIYYFLRGWLPEFDVTWKGNIRL